MSSYLKSTVHPETKAIENAEWLDDYFGQHNYGVRFPSDGKVFRADEFDWSKNPEYLAYEGVLRGGNEHPITIDQTEKGSRWGAPEASVEHHEDGKTTTTTKHEDGRQDVKIEVTRLDLKDPTPEDEEAAGAIEDMLSKQKVGVLVIYKPTNDNIYFTCSVMNVRKNAEMVIEKYREANPDKLVIKDDFIIVESAVVTKKPNVTTL